MMNKSSFSLHRTTSINTEYDAILDGSMIRSTLSAGTPANSRKNLKFLKERNFKTEVELKATLEKLRGAREENSRLIRQGLKQIRTSNEPRGVQCLQSKFLVDGDQAPVYLKQLMSAYLSMSAEAAHIQAALGSAEKLITYYSNITIAAKQHQEHQQTRIERELAQLTVQLNTMTNRTETRLEANRQLEQAIRIKQQQTKKMAIENRDAEAGLKDMRNTIENVESSLNNAQSRRRKLDEQSKLIHETLSKRSLVDKEKELRGLQIKLLTLREANDTLELRAGAQHA